jgi:hypothetical protein
VDPATLPASLVAVGAPDPERLEQLLEAGLGRLILAEADPERLAATETVLGEHEGGTLIPVALASETGERELVRYNQPGLRSLRPPTAALRRLFPGLRVRSRLAVSCLDPAQFLGRLGDPGALPGPVHLWIDAPGEEAALLEGFAAAGMFGHLARIDLRCPREVCFEGGEDLATLMARIPALGLSFLGSDETDPDWPVLHLASNPLVTDMRAALSAEREARATGEKALKAELKTVKARATRQQGTLQDKLAASQADLKDAQKAARAAEAEAARRHEAQEAELAQARAALTEAGKAARAAEAEAARRHEAQEAELAQVVQDAEAQQARLAATLAETRKALETARQEGAVSLRELEAKLSASQDALQATVVARDALAQELADIRARAEEQEQKLKTRAGRIAQLQEARDAACAETAELAERCATQERRLSEQEAKIARLTDVLSERDAALDRLEGDLRGARDREAALDDRIGQLDAQMIKAEADHQAALEQAQASARAAAEKLRADHDAALAALRSRMQEDRDAARADHDRTLAKALAEAAQDVQAAQDDRAAAQATADDRIASLEGTVVELRDTLARTEADLAARTRRNGTLEGGLASAEARKADLEQALERAQDDLAVALRMQGLAQADLRDLQERFRASEQTRSQQAALLAQLTPRLQQAAEQLRALTLAAPDGATPREVPLPPASQDVPDKAPETAPDTAEKPAPKPAKPRKSARKSSKAKPKSTRRASGDAKP